jgi:hypothetical protein
VRLGAERSALHSNDSGNPVSEEGTQYLRKACTASTSMHFAQVKFGIAMIAHATRDLAYSMEVVHSIRKGQARANLNEFLLYVRTDRRIVVP